MAELKEPLKQIDRKEIDELWPKLTKIKTEAMRIQQNVELLLPRFKAGRLSTTELEDIDSKIVALEEILDYLDGLMERS
ncbi:MAG: hypothetical protein Q8Q89_03725 [bacterium]|nr:hypothetical protein [bacterium]